MDPGSSRQPDTDDNRRRPPALREILAQIAAQRSKSTPCLHPPARDWKERAASITSNVPWRPVPYSVWSKYPPPPPEHWPRWPGGIVRCPHSHYYPHLVNGGKVMKVPDPRLAPPRSKPYEYDVSYYPEEKGNTALALAVPQGVLVAITHHSQAPPQPIISLGPTGGKEVMMVTISGGEARNCTQLLRLLEDRCCRLVQLGELMCFDMVIKEMTNILSTRPEVGLIAGWDRDAMAPAVYHVDGMQGLIKGEILATGSGFRDLYAFLDWETRISGKKNFPDSPSWLDNVLEDPSQKYSSWSCWSLREASKMALKGICRVANTTRNGPDLVTMFCVGRNRSFSTVDRDVRVEEVLRSCGMSICVHGKPIYTDEEVRRMQEPSSVAGCSY
ncbi:OLC1v1037107C1 [Oldenlandia corymbosa var. corymbosa]|uniref:OLC1v1037107C1 n=1 Tax=Oldenlandia corymbosa var. corymbosa TaxID=529605 RepID=A0AAV1D0J6_OLDCO|nr:OLC1v1037107C1 [Oldenlandia corymbosa var. corymbosa]